MASMQDRLKLKRVNCDTWTIREQLCLASSVLKSGDQNWMSVSRSLKPFIEKELLRPSDWFSQKSCAMQYAYLLENADTPKRKKRESGETTSESIVRKLRQERIAELNQTLTHHKNEYLRLKADINLLKSGTISDETLEKMWHDVQQEERETEQKTRAQIAWLAKRQQQQKQEISSPSISASNTNQTRKLVENTMDTTVQEPVVTEPSTENDDEKKNNKGGRSPLLTSLLKSPSPTTQTIQTFASTSVQASSPTFTSLLGSTSKIDTQDVSPQLQQLVSTAIASAKVVERPSVGAPTLSMLLGVPASATQRGSLLSLPATNSAANIQQQQQMAVTVATTITEAHNFEQAAESQSQIHQMIIQNEATNATAVTISAAATPALTAIVTAPTNIPVSENMVQIIDHIDDVIRKDIMTDVIDKDEINEIIGDIEELIKKEITHSPQTLDTNGSTTTTTTMTTTTTTTTMTTTTTTVTASAAMVATTMTTTTTTEATVAAGATTTAMTAATVTATTAVIGSLASVSQQTAEIPIVVQPKPEPRDVDEAVSLSDSPQSEMAIEEIDSSTSNIAEIIGTVAIEPQEPKIIVAEITKPVTNTKEEIKFEASICNERMTLTEDIILELETSNVKGCKNASMEGKQLDAEVKSSNATNTAEIKENDSEFLEKAKQTIEETVEEEVEEIEEEEEEIEVVVSEAKESSENVKEPKEPVEETEGKNNARLDESEINPAKITGHQQDVSSTEVVSVSSEVMNDVHSAEDAEKSQDISLILEDDENSKSSESKKKTAPEEQIIENLVENTESLESFKEESVLIKDKIIVEVKEEFSVKEEETVEETLEIYTDEFKKEEIKDSSEDTTSSILQDTEIKEEEIGSEAAEDITHVITIEEVESIKIEPEDTVVTNANVSIKKVETPEVKSSPKIEAESETSGSFRGKNPVRSLGMEEDKKEKVDIKEEKEDIKKTIDSEQSIKKEIESTAGEESAELDEEESSLSKLSSARAMKTYSKRQNIAMDSETENEGTGEGADYRAWKKAVMLVYNRLATHKYASVFLRPITEDQAPGYHSVIFRPMDLSTVKKNIDNGTIRSTVHFQRDVMLMFQNAIMYNKHDTFIYKMAVSMQEECLQHMQILVQVTGEGTFRRETRTATSNSSETSDSIIKRKRSHITPSPHDTDNPRLKKRRKSEND